MEQLGIELINAHSPQAKGRVERANSRLQDRLIKAMRIDKISGIDAAIIKNHFVVADIISLAALNLNRLLSNADNVAEKDIESLTSGIFKNGYSGDK